MGKEIVEVTTMTLKSIGCNPKKILALPEASRVPIVLGRIIGITSGLKFGEDKTGRGYVALTGDFIGFNADEPEKQYMGGKLFLPEGMHERIVAATENGGAIKPNGKPDYAQVEFAVEISVVPAGNPQGYSYQGKVLVDARPSDPMTALLEKISAGAPQLAAPAAATPAVDAPKEKAKK